MAMFPDDAADFAKDLERLGIRYESVDTIAGTIGYSISHVKNLLGGGKPYAPGARTKIGEMIAANGPVEPDPEFLTAAEIINQADDSVQPAGSYFNRLVIGTGYRVEGVPGGGYRITQTVAECVDQSFARAICDLLNGEQGQGDLQPGPILTPTNEQSGWSEPADLPPASDYAVIDATDGTAVLVEILARFNNHTAARKICQKLNGENG